jgi:hypothetical protein
MKTPTPTHGNIQPLKTSANGLPALWRAFIGCAASFAFAVIFPPILATALALAVLLSFARVFW